VAESTCKPDDDDGDDMKSEAGSFRNVVSFFRICVICKTIFVNISDIAQK